jgi:hypothetical protein
MTVWSDERGMLPGGPAWTLNRRPLPYQGVDATAQVAISTL